MLRCRWFLPGIGIWSMDRPRIRSWRIGKAFRSCRCWEKQTPDQVLEDREGVQIMQVLGKNMAWLLKCIEAGKQAGVPQPEKEERISTNYIR